MANAQEGRTSHQHRPRSSEVRYAVFGLFSILPSHKIVSCHGLSAADIVRHLRGEVPAIRYVWHLRPADSMAALEQELKSEVDCAREELREARTAGAR